MHRGEVKKFATGYNSVSVIFMAVVAFGIWIPTIIEPGNFGPSYVFNALVSGFLLWTLFGTYYFISGNQLYYRCGPFRGKIDIMHIRKIEHDDHFVKTSLMKLGLSRKGFKIYYDKFNDIFLSPKEKARFLETLLAINPDISVIENNK